ncbi:MAG: UDP-glucose 4-epimerase GalE [Planctomycetota bacterium]|nr:MAG: UDP-glucose 4-epimerase GalE [Planctomycetota bacterium]
MRIFVAGGAGYVGSHCVRRLVAAGHEVTVFDNLAAGHREAVDPKAAFVQGDLADRAAIDAVLSGGSFDAAMHFAAFLNVGESVFEPLKYYRNNVANTLNLLEAMRDAEVKRFVFSSTCAVYGEPEKLPIVEDLPKDPINPYGCTKLAVEWMLRDCGRAWGLGAVALRYFNASGAAADGTIGEDHDPEIHLIPLVLQVALGQRDHIKVFGTDYPTPDGSCIRDYIHVDDLAEAHLLAIENLEEGAFEAFNVGTGRGNSVLEIIEAARSVTGHEIPAEHVGRRAGDPPALYANSDRIRQRLGWSPRYTDVREIIQTAWRWHSAHPRGFERE